ncbi:MAG: zonular occludens toxin domain-containing protein [Chthoniobacter sp.]
MGWSGANGVHHYKIADSEHICADGRVVWDAAPLPRFVVVAGSFKDWAEGAWLAFRSMITLVEGLGVGAGKSYYVTHQIARHIAAGGTVYHTDDYCPQWETFYGPMEYQRPETIFSALRELFLGPIGRPRPMGLAYCIERKFSVLAERDQLIEVSADDVWKLHEVTKPGTDDCPVLIVVDEGQGGLNARDTMQKQKRPLFDWCCQSRHDSNDLIFLTQHVNNIDSQLRRICSAIFYVRNLAQVGFPGLGKIPLFLWQEFSP